MAKASTLSLPCRRHSVSFPQKNPGSQRRNSSRLFSWHGKHRTPTACKSDAPVVPAIRLQFFKATCSRPERGRGAVLSVMPDVHGNLMHRVSGAGTRRTPGPLQVSQIYAALTTRDPGGPQASFGLCKLWKPQCADPKEMHPSPVLMQRRSSLKPVQDLACPPNRSSPSKPQVKSGGDPTLATSPPEHQ